MWKRNIKSFSNEQWNIIFSFRNFVVFVLPKLFELCTFCRWNLIEILDQRSLSTGEPCTYEYIDLLQSFNRGTLSIHWYITCLSMSVSFRCFFITAISSRFLKVAVATSNFMKEVYIGRFTLEFSVSMLKEIMELVWDYAS